MNSAELISILLAPVSIGFGMMIFLIGLYSLTFNVADAHYKHHIQAEKTARIGGWLYIVGGGVMIVLQVFNG